MFFRLLKLGAYAFFAYALYEFFRGLTAGLQYAPPLHRREMSEEFRRSLEDEIRSLKEQKSRREQAMNVPVQSGDGGSSGRGVGIR